MESPSLTLPTQTRQYTTIQYKTNTRHMKYNGLSLPKPESILQSSNPAQIHVRAAQTRARKISVISFSSGPTRYVYVVREGAAQTLSRHQIKNIQPPKALHTHRMQLIKPPRAFQTHKIRRPSVGVLEPLLGDEFCLSPTPAMDYFSKRSVTYPC